MEPTMTSRVGRRAVLGALGGLPGLRAAVAAPAAAQPLSSWNDGSARRQILDFVRAVTDTKSPSYLPPADRIAAFDQDGTLWVEQPLYVQAMFALDRVRVLARDRPEWIDREPFASVRGGDLPALARFDEKDWTEFVAFTHAGISAADFQAIVVDWVANAKHPRFTRLYAELVYQPMVELIEHLRANEFTVYVVTGASQEFTRAYAEAVFGIPPAQVIGSSTATRYETKGGKPQLTRLPRLLFVNDRDGKPVGINLFTGKRPAFAFGNSDGDREMLEWTDAAGGTRLRLLLLHDDEQHEYAYGPAANLPSSKVGTFSPPLLEAAKARGWIVVSMATDWSRVFAFD
jgi:phosphoglycolate phosphatase-like HAD superfamily hydrolase